MGIKGLIKALKVNQLRSGHVEEFKDKSLAIDGYAWLHRGAYSCALELATGQATSRHIDFFMHRVAMLQHYGVIPIVVLDGAPLPGKAGVNAARSAKRKENLKKGHELMDAGRRFEAEQCFQKAISITAEMANVLHRTLLHKGIQCIVAPFEADAQMAYLVRKGIAAGVITEDSDMVPYGIGTVLYKVERCGTCRILSPDTLMGVNDENPHFRMPATLEKRIHVCILAGCDYLPSVTGIGIIKALALVNKWNTGPRAIKELRRTKKNEVPGDYEQQFRRAELTFTHHWVYDPDTAALVHLNPLPEDAADAEEEVRRKVAELQSKEEFLGTPFPDDMVQQVCKLGLVHATTLQPFPAWPRECVSQDIAAEAGGRSAPVSGGSGGARARSADLPPPTSRISKGIGKSFFGAWGGGGRAFWEQGEGEGKREEAVEEEGEGEEGGGGSQKLLCVGA